VLRVVIARPDQGTVSLKGFMLIGAFFLNKSNGGNLVCLLLASTMMLSQKHDEWLSNLRHELTEGSNVDGVESLSPTARLTVFGQNEEGTRIFWDLSPHRLPSP